MDNQESNYAEVELACGTYPEWADVIRDTHAQLAKLVPGYRIIQIKEKFWELRYYIAVPEGTSPQVAEQAYMIAWDAEIAATPYTQMRRQENG